MSEIKLIFCALTGCTSPKTVHPENGPCTLPIYSNTKWLKKRAHTGCTPSKIVHPALKMCMPGAGCTLNFGHCKVSLISEVYCTTDSTVYSSPSPLTAPAAPPFLQGRTNAIINPGVWHPLQPACDPLPRNNYVLCNPRLSGPPPPGPSTYPKHALTPTHRRYLATWSQPLPPCYYHLN